MSSEFKQWCYSSRSPVAEALLAPHRFARGGRSGPAEISPRLTAAQRAALDRWLPALPEEVASRLPRVKIGCAGRLWTPSGGQAHAASFIPHRYLLLTDPLFSRPGELGRILYHELCHFLWPRIHKGRRVYEAVIASEIAKRTRGELGHSAAVAKADLGNPRWSERAWRHYLCESFCDTGAYFLLGHTRMRRSRHSEWTLAKKARQTRLLAWRQAVEL